MSIQRLMVASVATKSVFKRFAQLSKEDKAKVINKVKEKVNGKGKSKAKKPEKGDVPPQLQKDEGSEEEPKKNSKKKAPKKTKKPVKKDEVVEEVEPGAEAPKDGTPAEEDHGQTEDGDMTKIVDDISKEIEVIKDDGRVTPSEVMGLIDKMMNMVNTLVRVKPGRVRKSSDEIAERVAQWTLEQ